MTRANNKLIEDNSELKDKIVFYDYVQQEMEKHRKEMETTVEATKKSVEKIKVERDLIKNCSQNINFAEEFRKSNELLTATIEQLRKEILENEQKLLALSDDCTRILDLKGAKQEKSEMQSRVIEYEMKMERLQREGDGMKLLLIEMERSVTAESVTNDQLYDINKNYVEKIEELEEKLNSLKKQ